jgi:hypothetical protein
VGDHSAFSSSSAGRCTFAIIRFRAVETKKVLKLDQSFPAGKMPDYVVRIRFRWANTRQRLLDSGNSPWLLRKTVVRLITALLALVSFVSFAAAIPSWNRVFVHMSGPSKGDWQDGIPIAPVQLSPFHKPIGGKTRLT